MFNGRDNEVLMSVVSGRDKYYQASSIKEAKSF